MTSHNVIARRAMEFERWSSDARRSAFEGLSFDRIDAVQGGAPWPDYLYACGDDHNAGEMDHWEPFQQHAANYIRSKYPDWASEPRSNHGPGLVAFFNGVISHYIADENWHGLCAGCEGKGFIKEIGYTDYTCTGDLCQNAHTATDAGGEFVASYQTDLSWYPKQNWYMPTQDLVNIFDAMNKTCDTSRTPYCPTTKAIYINECSVAFYAGSWAVSKFGRIVYPFLAKTLGEYMSGAAYIDSEIGGIDDNAAWTAFMQDRWASWVLDGPPTDDELKNLLNRREEDPPEENKREWMNAMKDLLKEDVDNSPFFVENAEAGAVRVGVGEIGSEHTDFLKKLASTLVHNYLRGGNAGLLGDESAIELEKALHEEIERLVGKSVDDVKDKELDYKSDIITTGMSVEVVTTLSGEQSHQQFGRSFDIISTEGDCESILVGSTGYSKPDGHPQAGIAQLFNTCDPSSNVELKAANSKEIPVYERYGGSVKLHDLNEDGNVDAIVCAPSWGGENVEAVVGNYTGRCDIFYGPLTEDVDPTFSIYGDSKWGLFGKHLVLGDLNGDGASDLVISAPQSGIDGDEFSNTGKVYIFDASLFDGKAKDIFASEAATLVLVGDNKRMHFGESLGVVGGRLIVGSPYWHQDMSEKYAVGKIEAFNLTEESADLAWRILGCDHASRVGGGFAASSSGSFAISETGFNHSKFELRSGKISILQSVDSLEGEAKICDIDGLTFLEPHDSEERLKDKLKLWGEARFGQDMTFGDDGRLLISAPGRAGGEIFVWDGGKLEEISVSDSEDGARMGEMIMWVGGGEGKLAANMPRHSLGSENRPDQEEYGKLNIWKL